MIKLVAKIKLVRLNYRHMITVDITPTVAIKNVTPMTEDEARESIEQINKGVQFIRGKLLELQRRRGWESLGYDSWKACCEQEFHSDRRRLNYMLQAADVEFELVNEGVDQGKIFPVPDSQLRELSKAPLKKRKEAFLLLKQWESESGSVTAADAEAAVCTVYPNACYNTAAKLVNRFIASGGDCKDKEALEKIFKNVHPRLKQVLCKTVKHELNSVCQKGVPVAQPNRVDLKIASALNAYEPEEVAAALLKMHEHYGTAVLLRLVSYLDKKVVSSSLKEMETKTTDIKALSDNSYLLCQHLDEVFNLPID